MDSTSCYFNHHMFDKDEQENLVLMSPAAHVIN